MGDCVMTSIVARVANRYEDQMLRGEIPNKVDRRLREQINMALIRSGLDGNGRFDRPEGGYVKALNVLADFGIELDGVVSSHQFSKSLENNMVRVDLAFTNPKDSFSPVQIQNSVLVVSFTKLGEHRYEAIAYLS